MLIVYINKNSSTNNFLQLVNKENSDDFQIKEQIFFISNQSETSFKIVFQIIPT